MKLLEPGETLDGFRRSRPISTREAWRISIRCSTPTAPRSGLPDGDEVPCMATGDGAENIVGFEVEAQILQALSGPHVPRFVAAGDLTRVPYLVMEYIEGKPLQHWLDEARESRVLTHARDHRASG